MSQMSELDRAVLQLVGLTAGLLAVYPLWLLLLRLLEWSLGPLESLRLVLSRALWPPLQFLLSPLLLRWSRRQALARSEAGLRRDWELAKLLDWSRGLELGRRDKQAAELAKEFLWEKQDPEGCLEKHLFSPVGMLKQRPLADLLRRSKENAYLKKVLKDLP